MLKHKHHYELDIKIDHIKQNDLPEIARLYEEAFSEHFLGLMGQKFLNLFCGQFMNSTTNYGYSAKCNGKTVGFLLGSIDEAPFNQFYRQNFIAIAMIVMKKYVSDSVVRKHLNKRLGNILVAIKTLLPSSKRVNNNANQNDTFVSPRLLAIGVDSNYRGMGIANKLTSQFCVEMKSKGFDKVGLSVLSWNRRAINFYKKDAWIVEESCETELSLSRSI